MAQLRDITIYLRLSLIKWLMPRGYVILPTYPAEKQKTNLGVSK